MSFKSLKQIFLYGVFGVLTTLVNIFVYWLCSRIFEFSVVPSTIIAWVLAVLFAYFTNGKYVFNSKAETFSEKFHEALNFFVCRLATGFIDVAIMYIFADLCGFNDVWVKVASNIIVVISNYIASKIFVFNNRT